MFGNSLSWWFWLGGQSGMQFSEGLAGIRVPTSIAYSYGRQVGVDCWWEASIPLYLGLYFPGILKICWLDLKVKHWEGGMGEWEERERECVCCVAE